MKGSAWKGMIGVGIVALALATVARAPSAATDGDAASDVRAMVRKILDAPEVMSDVTLERSDPFGGDPTVERGKLWYLPGRGLRLRSTKTNGQDLVVDRDKQKFYLYSPAENTIYQAPFEKAPARIRRLIQEPDRVLDKNLRAVGESRSIQGRMRKGYRILATGIGDSLSAVSIWVAPDPSTKQLRWLSVSTAAESLLIDLRSLTIRNKAEPGHLALSAPAGALEQPLDPRAMLGQDRGESR